MVVDRFQGGDVTENLITKTLIEARREDEACWCPRGSSEEGRKRKSLSLRNCPICLSCLT